MDVLAAIGWRVIPTIDLGPIEVSPHGLGIAVGYGLGGILVARRAERIYGISPQHIWNALTWAVVGVVIGSRLFYVVGHLDDYLPDDPLGIVRIWEGGLVFYGGVFGGILAAVPYLRKHGIPWWQAMDAAAPGFPLGLIFGRIGDLVIGDHLGGPTTLPWGFRYEGGLLPGCPAPLDSGISCPLFGEVVHQTALYDLVNALILFGVVMWLGRRRPAFDGLLILFTGVWYGIARFASDFARSAPLYGGLRGTQWISVALVLTGLWFLGTRARAGRLEARAEAAADEAAAEEMLAEGAPVRLEPDDGPEPHDVPKPGPAAEATPTDPAAQSDQSHASEAPPADGTARHGVPPQDIVPRKPGSDTDRT